MVARYLTDFFDLCGSQLGQGGFSTVQKATSRRTGQKVAVKTLSKSSGDFALIRSEIEIMAFLLQKVDSQHVIRMVDVFDDLDHVHLVLEVAEGGELFDRIIAKGHYSERDAARTVRQIALGLHAVHEAGVIHRDLKPENILYATKEDGSDLKIMDFGLSYLEGTEDSMKGLFGSLDYIAPECLSVKQFFPVSDTWSLGVIMYILCCGYPPFYADDARQKQKTIMRGKYDFDDELWEEVSEDAKDLIQKLLVTNPAKRLTAKQVLEHRWVADEASVSDAPRPRTLSDRLVNLKARRRFRVAVYAAVCVAHQMKKLNEKLRAVCENNTLTTEEVDRVRRACWKMSARDGGAKRDLSFPQFEAVMVSLGIDLPNLKRMFELFDTNADGVVDMKELVRGLSFLRESGNDPSCMPSEDNIRFCFNLYDEDGNGTLSRPELAQMVMMIKYVQDGDDGAFQAAFMEDLFEMMDENGDGKVTYDEFREKFRAMPELWTASHSLHNATLDMVSPSDSGVL